MTVKVKPLMWKNFDAWTYWAKCVVGTYRVQERNGVWKAILDSKDNADLIYEYTTDGLTPNDFEAAQIAAQADYEARILAAVEAPVQEPVAWRYRWKIDGEYVGWRFSDHSNAHPLLNGFEEAPLYTTPPDHLALVAAAYRDAANKCGAHSYSNNYFVSKTLHDAATGILARTPADAQAALTAIERAAWERGVLEAAATINRGGLHTSADYSDCILALLTQEGR